VRGGTVVACAWLRGDGKAPVALPAGEWRDVLSDAVVSGRVAVRDLCGPDGIALLERV
jgi:hypothetical protein